MQSEGRSWMNNKIAKEISPLVRATTRLLGLAAILGLLVPRQARAASPWETAVDVLQTAFTGPIARGLSLVAIVVGGLMFAFGEGESKRMLAGIVFGIGMAIGAVNFMAWLFP
jgi:type IV secretion system protein TrbC